jgi:hypothetical protein
MEVFSSSSINSSGGGGRWRRRKRISVDTSYSLHFKAIETIKTYV